MFKKITFLLYLLCLILFVCVTKSHAVDELLFLGDSITNIGAPYFESEIGSVNYDYVGNQTTSETNHGGVSGNYSHVIKGRILNETLNFTASKRAILIHAGTNDCSNSVTTTDIVTHVTDMVDMIHDIYPNTDIHVALLIPSTDSGINTNIIAFNSALDTALQTKQGTISNLYIVDMYTAFTDNVNYATEYYTDTVHPNATGYGVMGQAWKTSLDSAGTIGSTSSINYPDENTTLLIHANGEYGTTTFTDRSSKRIQITSNLAVSSATQKVFGSGSAYFSGVYHSLRIPDSTNFTFGSSDFTIDFRFYLYDLTGYQSFFSQFNIGGTDLSVYIRKESSHLLRFGYSLDGTNVVWVPTSLTVQINTWYHFAVVRDGATIRLFVNGVPDGTNNIGTGTIHDSTSAVQISGYASANTQHILGYIDEFRISDTARWTEDFSSSLPSEEYPVIYNRRIFNIF